MRITTILLAVALSTNAFAQITIGLNEMPAAGNTLTRTRANLNPFINYGATGANFNWNFTNLVAAGQDTRTYQTVGSTNIVYSLVYADIFFNPNRANHVTAGTDIPFSDLLPIEDPYTFLYRSNSVYRKVGFGAEVAGIPVPIIFDEQDVIYELPLNFGNTSSSFSAWSIDVPTLAYYGFQQQRENEVDGWGTVTTPSGTFDALRVRTTLDGRDSIQTDLVSLGFAIDRPRVTEYKWLANGIRVPVLQINTIEIFGAELVTEIFFYDEPRSITLAPPLAQTLCPGSTAALNYTKTGVFNPGGFLQTPNIFRAQLSDATGSFANPVNIGQISSTQDGTINVTIPLNTPLGTGYRIRVVSTNPAFIGSDNGFDITIGEAPAALAAATGATEFCEGGAVVLAAEAIPGASYQWQLDGADIPGAENAELTAQAAGNYAVVVSNLCGANTSDPLVVAVNPLPTYELAQTLIPLCDGGTASLVATDLSGSIGLNYQWTLDGDPIPDADDLTLEVGTTGSYVLIASNPATGCSFSSQPAVVEVETVLTPAVTALGNTTFCAGGTVTLAGDVGQVGDLQWYLDGTLIPGADDVTLEVATPGNYTTVAISSSGCESTASNSITVEVQAVPDAPVLTALDPTTFCAGGDVELTTTIDPGTTLQWSLDGVAIPGAIDVLLTASDAGSYTAVATGANGCASQLSGSIDVLVQPIPATPQISATGGSVFCEGGSVELSTIAGPGETIQWYLDGNALPAANDAILVASEPGIYSARTTNAFGCSSLPTLDLLVVVEPLPVAPQVSALEPTTFCVGGSVELDATAEPGSSFQWYINGNPIPAAGGAGFIADASGSYTVTATNAAGCTSVPSEAIEVAVVSSPAIPLVTVDGATTFCAGGSVTLGATSDPGATYQWLLNGAPIAGADEADLVASEAGTYTVVAINTIGCTSDASAEITLVLDELPLAPQVTSTGVTTFCEGGSVALQAAGAIDDGYQWYLNGSAIPGADQGFLEVTEGGDYTVSTINAAGCVSAPSDALVVNVVPYPDAPTIFAEGDIAFCEGLAVILTTDVSGVDFQWTLNGTAIPGAEGQSIEVFTSGSYALVVASGLGCTSDVSSSIDITVWPLPAAPQISQQVDTLFASGQGDLQWYLNGNPITGAVDDFLVVTENGDYSVGVIDANGCANISEVFPFSSVGIADRPGLNFNVFPNPSNGSFVMQLDALPGKDSYYTIHDATGKLVQQGGVTNVITPLEIRDARTGMYFLQVIDAERIITHRIVVGQ